MNSVADRPSNMNGNDDHEDGAGNYEEVGSTQRRGDSYSKYLL